MFNLKARTALLATGSATIAAFIVAGSVSASNVAVRTNATVAHATHVGADCEPTDPTCSDYIHRG